MRGEGRFFLGVKKFYSVVKVVKGVRGVKDKCLVGYLKSISKAYVFNYFNSLNSSNSP